MEKSSRCSLIVQKCALNARSDLEQVTSSVMKFVKMCGKVNQTDVKSFTVPFYEELLRDTVEFLFGVRKFKKYQISCCDLVAKRRILPEVEEDEEYCGDLEMERNEERGDFSSSLTALCNPEMHWCLNIYTYLGSVATHISKSYCFMMHY